MPDVFVSKKKKNTKVSKFSGLSTNSSPQSFNKETPSSLPAQAGFAVPTRHSAPDLIGIKESPLRKGFNLKKLKKGAGEEYVTVAEKLVKEKNGTKLRIFNVLPKKVKFETQEAKEIILVLLRQHWATQLSWMITAGLMILAPISLIWIPLISFMPGNFQTMALIMWYLLIIAFIYEKFITWFYHVFIITDERVIDVDFYNLLYKEVSEAKIDNIEDVTYRQGGVARAIFDYGDVEMQTAGEKQEFKIENVAEPHRVVKILNELKLEEEYEKIMGRVR
ncbi:MAG: PH domain-containing protein [Patescibacteria group bacterium]|nr:PH domain-containing protein [Patescibacteria group bacterium]